MTLGERLRKIRTGRDLLQQEVAQLIGVHRQYYVDIERGTCSPTWDTIRDLANLYQIEPTDLVCEATAAMRLEYHAQQTRSPTATNTTNLEYETREGLVAYVKRTELAGTLAMCGIATGTKTTEWLRTLCLDHQRRQAPREPQTM